MNRRTHLKYLMAAGTVTASTSFVRSYSAEVEPFIDPEGYHAYIDAAEAELRSGRLH